MKTEKVLISLFLVALIMMLTNVPGSALLLIVSLGLLSMIYFLGGIYFFSDKTIKQSHIVLSVLAGVALSVIPVGMLFKLLFWPGGTMLLVVGTISGIAILIATIAMKSKASGELNTYYKNMTLRSSILTAISIILLAIPTATLIETRYSDDPELARLMNQMYEEPNNQDYRKEYQDYVMKRDSLLLEDMTGNEAQ